jgi:hypothetical protein
MSIVFEKKDLFFSLCFGIDKVYDSMVYCKDMGKYYPSTILPYDLCHMFKLVVTHDL